jgi:tripeptidyl-peptidase-1
MDEAILMSVQTAPSSARTTTAPTTTGTRPVSQLRFGRQSSIDQRGEIRGGKGPVGFINPTFYANPQVLIDITNGTNPGCDNAGFEAVEGWDPITGLGTPKYPKLLELFMSLP